MIPKANEPRAIPGKSKWRNRLCEKLPCSPNPSVLNPCKPHPSATEMEFRIMLILSRRESESVHLGDDIVLTIVRVSGEKVRIGIQAPPHIKVLRNELELQVSEPPLPLPPPNGPLRSRFAGPRDQTCPPPLLYSSSCPSEFHRLARRITRQTNTVLLAFRTRACNPMPFSS